MLAGANREILEIHEWAVAHHDRILQARTHLVWANIHRLLGDAAKSLEHSLSSVELLDGTATGDPEPTAAPPAGVAALDPGPGAVRVNGTAPATGWPSAETTR